MTALATLFSLLGSGVAVLPKPDGTWALLGPREAIAALADGDKAALRAELTWRRLAMGRSVPAIGSVPLLAAKPSPVVPAGCCWSCGEALPADAKPGVRCPLCCAAAHGALLDARTSARQP